MPGVLLSAVNMSQISQILTEIYKKMFSHFGPQKWWPAESKLEVIVGTILTQNTSWTNVEKAISNLKKEKGLSVEKLESISEEKLAELIKSSGYFNLKAKRLKNFIHFLRIEYEGKIEKMAKEENSILREKLLSITGVGPETADSILLYALEKPVFVIDQYTYRILHRHHLIPEETTYQEMQELMMNHLPEKVEYYNEYHAQIVMIGKNFCKKKPNCEKCPLNGINW